MCYARNIIGPPAGYKQKDLDLLLTFTDRINPSIRNNHEKRQNIAKQYGKSFTGNGQNDRKNRQEDTDKMDWHGICNRESGNVAKLKIKIMNAQVTTTSVTQSANEVLGTKEKKLYYLVVKTAKGQMTINVGEKTHNQVEELTSVIKKIEGVLGKEDKK